MNRSMLKGALVVIATGALLTGGVAPAFADGDTDGHGGHGSNDQGQTVEVVGNGASVTIDDHSIHAGTVRFDVSTTNPVTPDGGGSQVTLFKLNHGASLDTFNAALAEEFSDVPATAAQGTKDLKAAATFRGLADVVPDFPEVVTESLDRGTYYLMDLANVDPTAGPPELIKLKVRGGDDPDRGGLRADVAVKTVGETFVAPDTWPAKGSYSFTNKADTIHFMAITPVVPGTTDAEIQAFFDDPNPTGPPTFFADGPAGGNDVVSPGYSLKVDYDLTPGTYVLLCFVADEEDGTPHAVMGMHKVVVLE